VWSSNGVHQERLLLAIVARRLASQPVDPPVACSRDDPSDRARRHTGFGPPLYGDCEGFLDRFLGDVDVTEEADQACHRSTGLGAKDALDV